MASKDSVIEKDSTASSKDSDGYWFKFSVANIDIGNYTRVRPICIHKKKQDFITGKQVREYLEKYLGQKVVLYQHRATIKDETVVDVCCAFKFASEDGTVYPVTHVRNVGLYSIGDSSKVKTAGNHPVMLLFETIDQALDTFLIFSNMK